MEINVAELIVLYLANRIGEIDKPGWQNGVVYIRTEKIPLSRIKTLGDLYDAVNDVMMSKILRTGAFAGTNTLKNFFMCKITDEDIVIKWWWYEEEDGLKPVDAEKPAYPQVEYDESNDPIHGLLGNISVPSPPISKLVIPFTRIETPKLKAISMEGQTCGNCLFRHRITDVCQSTGNYISKDQPACDEWKHRFVEHDDMRALIERDDSCPNCGYLPDNIIKAISLPGEFVSPADAPRNIKYNGPALGVRRRGLMSYPKKEKPK